MIVKLVTPACAMLLMAGVLGAQTVSLAGLATGARVRVEAACTDVTAAPGRAPSPTRRDRVNRCTRIEGTLVRVGTDSLAIVLEGREMVLPWSGVRAMQVRSGTRGNAALGAGVGAGLGLAVGIGAAVSTKCSRGDMLYDLCQSSQALAPIAGAAVGAGVGALVGVLVRSDRWVTVLIPRPGTASPDVAR